jgi:hypothetical protein
MSTLERLMGLRYFRLIKCRGSVFYLLDITDLGQRHCRGIFASKRGGGIVDGIAAPKRSTGLQAVRVIFQAHKISEGNVFRPIHLTQIKSSINDL